MGSAWTKTWDTLQLAAGLSMDILTLDIVVIVVLAEDIMTEVEMLKGVNMGWMAVSSQFELMEFVCGVGWIVDKAG
jgi:hypothetical protein